MLDQFTVPQEKGKDSQVSVFEFEVEGWHTSKPALRFETDQSMQSNSVRAGEVETAIDNYAMQRGYRLQKPFEKFEVIAVYDTDFHSSVATANLRKQIVSHPRYERAIAATRQEKNQILAKYGRQIDQLKELISCLEKREAVELEAVKQNIISDQIEILNTLDIPEIINERDMRWLKKPIEKIEHDHYKQYHRKIPANAEQIIELLD